MKIAENVEMLELAWQAGAALYPVLVWDDKDAVLIDTGFPEQFDLLRAEVEKTGLSLERITKIILTHQDMDHIGNAKLLRELGAKRTVVPAGGGGETLAHKGVQVLAHEKEAPYIQGDEPSPKLLKMEARMKEHPQEVSPEERAMYERMKTVAPSLWLPVDQTLKDGEVLPCCGGIEVVYTPGHTPGHISLLLRSANVLVTGDAANGFGGVLTGPNPKHTLDMVAAQRSFERLRALNPKLVVCYHGGLCHNGGASRS